MRRNILYAGISEVIQMLSEINYQNKERSIYKCDRCKKRIGQLKYLISVKSPLDKCSKKKWDLCTNCYKSLCKGIEKRYKMNFILNRFFIT